MFNINFPSIPLSASARIMEALVWLNTRSELASSILEVPLSRLHAIDLAFSSLLFAAGFICLLDGVQEYTAAVVLFSVAVRLAAVPLGRFIANDIEKGGRK